MSLSRKDFDIIALAMGRAEARIHTEDERWGLEEAVSHLKGALSDINPRFDRMTFDMVRLNETTRIRKERE